MRRLAAALVSISCLSALPGCHGAVGGHPAPGPVVVRPAGPPPHAPAHGYRHKHASGAELRFDAGIGVYAVVGHSDLYFHDGWFLRFHSGVWQVSASLGGRWEARGAEWVPTGLRAKALKARKRHRHKHHPAKGHP